MYINKEICAKCKGKCCKQSGCMLSTRDIKGDITTALETLIENKSIVIYSMPINIFLLFAFRINVDKLIFNADTLELIQRASALREYENVFLIKMRSINQDVFFEIQNPNDIDNLPLSGECIFLTPTGCKYTDEERPYGGKALKPDIRGFEYCKNDFSVLDAALEWLEYHSILESLWKRE